MEWLVETIIRPFAQRIGTALGAYLTTLGMAQNDISVLVAAVPVALGLMFDLIQRRYY